MNEKGGHFRLEITRDGRGELNDSFAVLVGGLFLPEGDPTGAGRGDPGTFRSVAQQGGADGLGIISLGVKADEECSHCSFLESCDGRKIEANAPYPFIPWERAARNT